MPPIRNPSGRIEGDRAEQQSRQFVRDFWPEPMFFPRPKAAASAQDPTPAARDAKQLLYLGDRRFIDGLLAEGRSSGRYDAQVLRWAASALVVLIALWLPARHAAFERSNAPVATTHDSTQTERPSPAPDLTVHITANPARAWTAGPFHGVLAPVGLWLAANQASAASQRFPRFHLLGSTSLRTFPLQI
jgi:hypothetical protein